ncbi:MAG: endonuclease, partial [Crenarchaeota archaeon]|nr:endonuclease [Thermoproteota archaeon]
MGSWNVRVVETKDSLSGNAWSKRFPHIANSILFTDYDIIGIQEADSAQTADLGQILDNYSYYLP